MKSIVPVGRIPLKTNTDHAHAHARTTDLVLVHIVRTTSEFIFGPLLFDRLSQIPRAVHDKKIIPPHMYTQKRTCNIMFSYTYIATL